MKMSELLESRWQDTKTALLEGLEGNRKSVMAVTLENTRKYLSESATAGATSAGNVATLNRVILPVIRRVMPTTIANELVGVQPMTGPVGQIHTLRVRYADSATGVTAGEEALSPFKIAHASYQLAGHLNQHKTHKPCKALTSKLKSWQHWLKKSQLRLTKKS